MKVLKIEWIDKENKEAKIKVRYGNKRKTKPLFIRFDGGCLDCFLYDDKNLSCTFRSRNELELNLCDFLSRDIFKFMWEELNRKDNRFHFIRKQK